MKKTFLLLIFALLTTKYLQSQNVGIGTTTPTGPLSFNNTIGNKIVLWGDGNAAHYGLGIQSASLQIHSDSPGSDIIFGTGSSSLFTERMRLNTYGGDGLNINGRIILKNGTTPLDLNYGSGVWIYKADNSALLGFMGAQNNQNLGFYGGPGGWGFTYDAINSRVGIGNNNPNSPLSFAPSLGKKITLYPGATGDVGFGVAGNRLQIYSDNPNADVAIGYDAAGTFNERFAVKPTGALAVNGNTGADGQVLTSKGSGASAQWQSPLNSLYQNTVQLFQSSIINVGSGGSADLPGMAHSFTVQGNAKVLVNININTEAPACALCGFSRVGVSVYIDDVFAKSFILTLTNNSFDDVNGSVLLYAGPGTHTVKLKGYHVLGPAVNFWGSNSYSNMIVQIINE
jgi:hypothetical protein